MLKLSPMKTDRRRFLVASSAALVLAKSQLSSSSHVRASESAPRAPSEPLRNEGRIEGREVTVYTTADKSNHRLSAIDTLTLIYTNSYYYIGHFSKFVRPGAKRIASSPSRSQLLSTAFLNPDGKVSVVVMNKSDKNVSYYLWVDGQAAEVSSLPHSIQTLVF